MNRNYLNALLDLSERNIFSKGLLPWIVFIVIRRLIWGDPVDGWASTVCIILFCSGLQLFAIGILDQYMAKTYTEVKQRPHFIIREMQ